MQQSRERTGKPKLMKELNRALLLDALEQRRQATRVELAALTGISQPTVNTLISQLQKEKLVVSLGIAGSTGGRKAELFALNQKRAAVLAVLVKERYLDCTVLDLELNAEAEEQIPRTEQLSFLEQLLEEIRRLQKTYERIKAVAVGVPGAVSEQGEVFAIPMIPEWEGMRLRQRLEQGCGLPVIVMNDINAIALGYQHGSGGEARNLVYLNIGKDGTGAGIIIDGKLYPGPKSFAGEVGYMQLGADLTLQERSAEASVSALAECDAGAPVSVSAECDARASVPALAECDAGAPVSVSAECDAGVSVPALAERSPEAYGQDAASRTEQRRLALIGRMAVNLICVLNPEQLVFGGGAVGERQLVQIRRECRRCLPEEILPEFVLISAEAGQGRTDRDYYRKGLGKRGKELLDQSIRLA